MQYINLGKTGLKVSRICLGAMTYGSKKWREWVLEEDEARPFFRRAIELGINFFDTADMYSVGVSEEITGRALRDFTRRDQVVLATKVFNPMGEGPNDRGLSRYHIMNAIDASLKRLGVDYVDLYQIHRFDPSTPLEETLEALNDVVRAGKARYIGASSMYAWQFARALYLSDRYGWARFVTMQNHYNLLYREEEREMMPLCRFEGIGVIPWSPLARGFLTRQQTPDDHDQTVRARTDDYARGMYYQPADYAVNNRLMELSEQRGLPAAQLALAWLLQQPGVTAPIIGASKMSHLEDAVASLDVRLSAEEMALLQEEYQPHPILGHS